MEMTNALNRFMLLLTIHFRAFKKKTYNDEHKCNKMHSKTQGDFKSFVALYTEKIKKDPTISATKLKEMVQDHLQVNATINMVRRVKAKVIEKVSKNYKDELQLLWDYFATIKGLILVVA